MKGSERKHRVKMDIVVGDPKSQEKLLRLDVRSTKNYDRLFSTKITSEASNSTNRMVFIPQNNI